MQIDQLIERLYTYTHIEGSETSMQAKIVIAEMHAKKEKTAKRSQKIALLLGGIHHAIFQDEYKYGKNFGLGPQIRLALADVEEQAAYGERLGELTLQIGEYILAHLPNSFSTDLIQNKANYFFRDLSSHIDELNLLLAFSLKYRDQLDMEEDLELDELFPELKGPTSVTAPALAFNFEPDVYRAPFGMESIEANIEYATEFEEEQSWCCNLTMQVISGFCFCLGIAAVALAITVVMSPVAMGLTLGLAATAIVAGAGLFATALYRSQNSQEARLWDAVSEYVVYPI